MPGCGQPSAKSPSPTSGASLSLTALGHRFVYGLRRVMVKRLLDTNIERIESIGGAKIFASLSSDSEGVLLSKLIDRYLGGSNQALADWLMSRKADEIAICLRPKTLSSWDFSERMSDG